MDIFGICVMGVITACGGCVLGIRLLAAHYRWSLPKARLANEEHKKQVQFRR